MPDAVMIPIFFFSSRRRHTRFSRDWSSDVCSSDLAQPPGPERTQAFATAGRARGDGAAPPRAQNDAPPTARRSEERRVGKECRARWGPYYQKKNESDRTSENDEREADGIGDESTDA